MRELDVNAMARRMLPEIMLLAGLATCSNTFRMSKPQANGVPCDKCGCELPWGRKAGRCKQCRNP